MQPLNDLLAIQSGAVILTIVGTWPSARVPKRYLFKASRMRVLNSCMQTCTHAHAHTCMHTLVCTLDEGGPIPDERPALPLPPGHTSAGATKIPMPSSRPCLRCSQDKYLLVPVAVKLLCASSIAGDLGWLAGNGSGTKKNL